MEQNKRRQRYARILAQLEPLCRVTEDPICRMATIAALVHHKMGHFFWFGFYRLVDGELLVGPYQGSMACQRLEKDTGVCWACVNRNETILVPDVEQFPGHIACDGRSKSEIVVPVRDEQGKVRAVLDADSDKLDTYDEVDAEMLGLIAALVHKA